jgi:Mrp family chromosome partitioning ATPase
VPPNPSELLMSDQMKVLIEKLRLEYDMIVFLDTPLGLASGQMH